MVILHFFSNTFAQEHWLPNRIIYWPIISPPLQERRIDPRDSRRASISHGTSPSRGVSNLRSDEPQAAAAAASSRSGTIKSTAVPWVYGKRGCVGEFRAWRNRGRRQSAIPWNARGSPSTIDSPDFSISRSLRILSVLLRNVFEFF